MSETNLLSTTSSMEDDLRPSSSAAESFEEHDSTVSFDSSTMDYYAGLMSSNIEIQLNILRFTDIVTLSKFCRVNSDWRTKAWPRLWANLDFEGLQEEYGQDVIGMQVRFIHVCDRMAEQEPERWQQLAALVRSIKFVRFTGHLLPPRGNKEITDLGDEDPYLNSIHDTGCIVVMDWLDQFPNLQVLQIYFKCQIWSRDDGTPRPSFPKLRVLRFGGMVSLRARAGLLKHAESIEELCCYNLQEYTMQDLGPLPGTLQCPGYERFQNLSVLHLCKHAQLTRNRKDTSYRFRWFVDEEKEQLRDWAELVKATSKTLVEVTFEDMYITDQRQKLSEKGLIANDSIVYTLSARSGREKWTSASTKRFWDTMGDTLESLNWPSLRKLKFIGVDPRQEKQDAFQELTARGIRVEYAFGRILGYEDEATPLILDEPEGCFSLEPPWRMDPKELEDALERAIKQRRKYELDHDGSLELSADELLFRTTDDD